MNINTNKYGKFTTALLTELESLVGKECVNTDADSLEKYGQDETEDLVFRPEVVVRPTSVEQVSKIAAFCDKYHITLTTRDAGTGLSGGALPIHGGLMLSMDRFNR